jgi:hypothetical protein
VPVSLFGDKYSYFIMTNFTSSGVLLSSSMSSGLLVVPWYLKFIWLTIVFAAILGFCGLTAGLYLRHKKKLKARATLLRLQRENRLLRQRH